ncbi:IS481 family transposase [Pseudomonas oryzihabitans]|uniref:IS481 family transposase n=1 Tax=Pseudomonas oryzihabitans TaxID=47885 RepID=UPI00111DCA72|nr:IS481 family transposase [Pseudomonas psychrotolerans]QDD89307.1 IS481 family transposase [Pseudomonas psychrotolerans]
MPWQGRSTMELREEFVGLAQQAGANIRLLCRRFGISPTTGYKWLARARAGEALTDRSRRPATSPSRCAPEQEAQVMALRAQHPAWGARKLARRLEDQGVPMPAISTVHAILVRHGAVSAAASAAAKPWQRFEHPHANDLWQMDFKGHVPLLRGRCHPLTVLDDHSRYAVVLQACGDERESTVRQCLIAAFERYGLPARMTMDNGSPWGTDGQHYTRLDVWLMAQGIRVSHSRPYHPQTQGKDERFHRTLKAEVLQGPPWADLDKAQRAFDHWRQLYNAQRPHQALGMQVPQTRYQPSPRAYCPAPSAPLYAEGGIVRTVRDQGLINWRGHQWHVGKAFIGEPMLIRPEGVDGQYDVFWRTWRIACLNLHTRTATTGRSVA